MPVLNEYKALWRLELKGNIYIQCEMLTSVPHTIIIDHDMSCVKEPLISEGNVKIGQDTYSNEENVKLEGIDVSNPNDPTTALTYQMTSERDSPDNDHTTEIPNIAMEIFQNSLVRPNITVVDHSVVNTTLSSISQDIGSVSQEEYSKTEINSEIITKVDYNNTDNDPTTEIPNITTGMFQNSLVRTSIAVVDQKGVNTTLSSFSISEHFVYINSSLFITDKTNTYLHMNKTTQSSFIANTSCHVVGGYYHYSSNITLICGSVLFILSGALITGICIYLKKRLQNTSPNIINTGI
jgi:hypothetical protein